MPLTVAIFACAIALSGQAAQPLDQPATVPSMREPGQIQPRQVVEDLSTLLRESIGLTDRPRADRVLAGLRALHDPSTLPFFAQLAISPSPTLQVHGLLGLAELEPRRGLDLLAVSRMSDTRLRGVIVSEAHNAGLIADETLSELSGWENLPAQVRVELAASCAGRGRAFSITSFQRLLRDEDPATAFAAAAVLSHAGVSVPQKEQLYRAGRAAMTSGLGVRARRFAQLVIQNNLDTTEDALAMLAQGVTNPDTARWLDAARLFAEPENPEVVSAARTRLDIATPAVERAAFALLTVEAAYHTRQRTPRILIDEMATDPTPLIKGLSRVADALSRGDEGYGVAVASMARLGDPPSVAWAVRAAVESHWQEARLIRLAVLEGIARRPPGSAVDPRLAEQAAQAVTNLCDDQPRDLDRPLAEALGNGDEQLVRIILAGVLRSVHPGAGALVRQGAFESRPAGPWPSPAAADLAVLVAVRHEEFVADPQQRIARLTSIARQSGSTLTDVDRAQAAWLALRASGEHRVALARILSDLAPSPSDTPAWTAPPPASTP